MRPAAAQQLGFFPFPPDALPLLLGHVWRADSSGPPSILDPCAGEGEALAAIVAGLNAGLGPHVGAVELDGHRAEVCRERLPGCNVAGPASIFGMRVSPGWSMVYLNAPFDHVLGGGQREETAFLVRATGLIKPGGILVMVVPKERLIGYASEIPRHVDTWYEDARAYKLPREMRKHRECVVFGRRRKFPLATKDMGWDELQALPMGGWSISGARDEDLPILGSDKRTWRVPPGEAPRCFAKTQYTDAELAEVVAKSPVSGVVREPAPRRRRRPPLALGEGHIGIMLASGHLDGIVRPEGEPPILVRGTERKEKYVKDVEERESSGGTITTKTTTSERPVLTVRFIDQSGQIHTLEQ